MTRRAGRVPLFVGAVLVVSVLTLGAILLTRPTHNPQLFVDLAPAQIVARAQIAANHAGSVHSEVRVTHGAQVETLEDDSSATSGHQVIKNGSEEAEIVVVDQVAYVRGNSSALTGYFNYPAPVAARLAGRWVSFRPSDIGYANVTVGITLRSTLEALAPRGGLHRGAQTHVGGFRVVGVTGTSSTVDGTLFVQVAGAHLPVGAAQVSGSGTSRTVASVRLSRWGERIVIDAPPGAIPISSFTSQTPPSTTTPAR